MTGSRFLQPKTSRFLQKVATPISRFVQRHRTLQRIVRRIPLITKFMAFFAPDELTLSSPAFTPEPQQAAKPITPVYNRRARRPKGLTLG